jgi:hypothetical protein
MDVRRLAAIDMHGGHGRMLRRRLILAEFLAGFVIMVAVGVWMVLLGGWTWLPPGVWFIGVGLNYLAVLVHAVDLYRPGVLDAELAGVNIYSQARRYNRLQFWVLVPLSMVVFALAQLRRRAPSS